MKMAVFDSYPVHYVLQQEKALGFVGRNTNTAKSNAETLAQVGKKIVLEVHTDKLAVTNCM
jgi:hypothetical protein